MRGFSLVELSIVLVILGLLVGGILAGQSLIRASELRSISSDITRYQTAALAFRDKYFALPGDFTNAVNIWGQAASGVACVTTDSTTLSDPRLTCNGDGTGTVTYWAPYSNEYFRFWQHMANAGLIEGQFTGVEGSTGNPRKTITGVNIPRGKMAGVGYGVESKGSITSADLYYWEGYGGNALEIGKDNGTVGTEGGILRGEEAWNIDTKIDDGKPSMGKLRTMKSASNACITTNVFATSEYQLSSTLYTCQLMYYNFTGN